MIRWDSDPLSIHVLRPPAAVKGRFNGSFLMRGMLFRDLDSREETDAESRIRSVIISSHESQQESSHQVTGTPNHSAVFRLLPSLPTHWLTGQTFT